MEVGFVEKVYQSEVPVADLSHTTAEIDDAVRNFGARWSHGTVRDKAPRRGSMVLHRGGATVSNAHTRDAGAGAFACNSLSKPMFRQGTMEEYPQMVGNMISSLAANCESQEDSDNCLQLMHTYLQSKLKKRSAPRANVDDGDGASCNLIFKSAHAGDDMREFRGRAFGSNASAGSSVELPRPVGMAPSPLHDAESATAPSKKKFALAEPPSGAAPPPITKSKAAPPPITEDGADADLEDHDELKQIEEHF